MQSASMIDICHVLKVQTLGSGTDLLIYQSSNRQAVEAVCKRLPQANVIPPFALIIKSIDPVDGGALMIASQQEEVFRILDLQVQWNYVVAFDIQRVLRQSSSG